MKMPPFVVALGSTAIMASVIFANVVMPSWVFRPKPSANAVPYTAQQLRGREIYIQNGCLYCHSQDTRAMDWGEGSGMSAEPGDYAYDSPHLIGSERNGPDLFREGGYHTDDWHWAHFEDPRYTRPQSFMPSYKFVRGQDRRDLIAYIQCLGGRDSQARAAEQAADKVKLIKYYEKGAADNVAYVNSTLPHEWLTMPNPVPVTIGSVGRGKVVYESYCIGCHGEYGDGRGPARPYLNPPPMDFTLQQATGATSSSNDPPTNFNRINDKVSKINNGAVYLAVLYGLPGSAMPQFKGQLESEKIWDVGNYIGNAFMGWPLQAYRGKYDELSKLPEKQGCKLKIT
jgi:cytochrome c oxidase cbb3-type subunit II